MNDPATRLRSPLSDPFAAFEATLKKLVAGRLTYKGLIGDARLATTPA